MNGGGIGASAGRSARVVSVVDVDTGEELLPVPAPPPRLVGVPAGVRTAGHSDWDAKVLIASWAALYPEMTDLIREWIGDAWARGLTIQLTETLVRRRAEVERARILADRERRAQQIDDPVARRSVEPANAYEAQLIDLKDESDALRARAGDVKRTGSDAPPMPRRKEDGAVVPQPPPMVSCACPKPKSATAPGGAMEPGLTRLPPHLQPAMDAAEAEHRAAVESAKQAKAELKRAKADAKREDKETDALEAAAKLAEEARLKKKAGGRSLPG